eukprot:4983604-Amphidinium_carterae.2
MGHSGASRASKVLLRARATALPEGQSYGPKKEAPHKRGNCRNCIITWKAVAEFACGQIDHSQPFVILKRAGSPSPS